MDYTTANRPFLRKPDGTVVRFNDVRKVDDLPNGNYEVFTAEGNTPNGRVLESKTLSVNCPLPVNTAPDRFTITVDAPLPDEPPVVVAVSEVLANATDVNGDSLSVVGFVSHVLFNMESIDDRGTPANFDDDVVTLDTNPALQCGIDPTIGFVISDNRGGITRYGTLRFDNPFGPTWLCGNPW